MRATPSHGWNPPTRLASTLILAICLAGRATAADGIPGLGWVAREILVLPSLGRPARIPFRADPVEASLLAGTWRPPQAGDTVPHPSGTNVVWKALRSDDAGNFENGALRGGYAYLTHVSPIEQTVLLNAAGHNLAYVNGEPHAGDPYQYGYSLLPVRLAAGTNHFLFSAGRGRLRVKLLPAAKPVSFNLGDATLPDLVAGEKNDVWGAVIVVNSSTQFLREVTLQAEGAGFDKVRTALPSIPPMSTRKVGFRVRHGGKAATNRVDVTLSLSQKGLGELDRSQVALRLRKPLDTRRETFVSEIDGSVQYYGFTPARPTDESNPARALVLSTHGASVEALGQAEAYAPKAWAHIVAPTNRRPYGFDWEEWGRMDAIEVLELAQKRLGTDPRRTYLTGHSMGGHGTWQLGVTFPDRFAAIAPSAGWISFLSYAGGLRDTNSSPVRQLVQRAANPSDTLLLASNYLHHAIYILHGDADDNVPVTEARTMKAVLEPFHRDFSYHEQPGAGHWWGNPCVDWPPIFDLFSRHQIPDRASVRRILFSTANPGINSRSHWASIEAQEKPLQRSTIDIEWDSNRNSFVGRSENIARLSLDTRHLKAGQPIQLTLDGQVIPPQTNAPGQPVFIERRGDQWTPVPAPGPALKGPHRSGPFKEAFRHRMIFVYGTTGTPAENAWSFARARLDSELFWYRGNGGVDIVPDTEFTPAKFRDRGVVLYGNRDSNGAWDSLLKASPIQVHRGQVLVGDRSVKDNETAALFLRPRPDSDVACVAVVSGSGLKGMRLTDRIPYFLPGVALPDCAVFGPEVLTSGADGVKVAGFFGNDWSVGTGEFAWRE